MEHDHDAHCGQKRPAFSYAVIKRLGVFSSLTASCALVACIGRIEPDGSAHWKPGSDSSPSRNSAGGSSGGSAPTGKNNSNAGAGSARAEGGASSTGGGSSLAGSGPTVGGAAGQAGGDGTGETPVHAACEISITDISVSQAVEIPIVEQGNAVPSASRRAPLIQNKKTLFRVYVDPTDDGHEVIARLTLKTGDETRTVTDTKTLSEASSQSRLNSTFNFVVDADQIGDATEYSVELTEAQACSGDKGTTRFPEIAEQELGAIQTGTVRVLLVPIRTSGGSEPVADEELAELFEVEGNAQYPSSAFEVSIAEQGLSLSIGMSLNGAGWEEVLDRLDTHRQSEDAPDNLHYYGLVRPTSQFSGGVAGLAGGTGRRGSTGIGISYPERGKSAAGTFVHELGHMHSLRHSPGCGAAGPDGNYPKSDGHLDGWGWDSRKNALVDPDSTFDFLSYCDPTWVSAHVYNGLVNPVRAIQKESFVVLGELTRYQSVIVDAEGNAKWGSSYASKRLPDGDPETVEARDASGNVVAKVTAYRVPVHDSGSSFVRVPDVKSFWKTLHIRGAKPIAISTIP